MRTLWVKTELYTEKIAHNKHKLYSKNQGLVLLRNYYLNLQSLIIKKGKIILNFTDTMKRALWCRQFKENLAIFAM